jgi:hypothetical protein
MEVREGDTTMIDNDHSKRRALVAGVGLLLLFATFVPAAQGATIRTHYPCISTSSGGVNVEDCGTSTVNTVLYGSYPMASTSDAFDARDAIAVAEDVNVEWSFNGSQANADPVAFHVERGLDPHLPMERVATLDANATSFLDDDAMASGDLWYVVEAELSDGSVERSQPFRVNGAQVD